MKQPFGFPATRLHPTHTKRRDPEKPAYLRPPFTHITEDDARAINRNLRDKYNADLEAFKRGDCVEGCPGCAFPLNKESTQVSPQANL